MTGRSGAPLVRGLSHGRLAHVLAVREAADPERPMHMAHREALIYTLGKAAELEHLVMRVRLCT